MINHDETTKCFYQIDEGYKSFVVYEIKDKIIDITTTQVPKAVSGRGIASKLVAQCVKFAQDSNLTLRNPLSCSYAQGWVERH